MKPQERTRRILKSALEPSQKLLLVAIADHMEDTAEGEDRNSRPSVALLCEETGLGERAVQGHLKALDLAGVLVRHQLPGHRTPHYQIRWDCLPAPVATLTAEPPQNLRPAESAPRRICAPTPAESAGVPPQNLRPRQTTQGTIKATSTLSPKPPPIADLPAPAIQAEREVQVKSEEEPSFYRLFGPNLAKALTEVGVTTLDQLCRLTAHQTRMLKGVGEGNVAVIQTRLQALGRDFADGRVAPTTGPPEVKKRKFDLNPETPSIPNTSGKPNEQRRTSAGT